MSWISVWWTITSWLGARCTCRRTCFVLVVSSYQTREEGLTFHLAYQAHAHIGTFRQINVGGWSLSSTFGVRLYTPDGSAGVNGTNDWEENVNELTLQVSSELLVLGSLYLCVLSVADGILPR